MSRRAYTLTCVRGTAALGPSDAPGVLSARGTCTSRSLRDDTPCELSPGHGGPHRAGRRSWTREPAPRRSGPSGRTLSHAERRARGDVLVTIWLAPEDAALLEEIARAWGSRAAAVRQAIREAARGYATSDGGALGDRKRERSA